VKKSEHNPKLHIDGKITPKARSTQSNRKLRYSYSILEILNCEISRRKRNPACGLPRLSLCSIFTILIPFTYSLKTKKKKTLRGLSPRANYTDRATVACRRSWCQFLWIVGATIYHCKYSNGIYLDFIRPLTLRRMHEFGRYDCK
jgi:transposase InsO family protein